LQDNGGDNLAISAKADSFLFANAIAGAYSVTVSTQPAGENCSVINGSGTATANVTNVVVVCVGEWTWTAGSSTIGFNDGQAGVYGTLGTPSPTNFPGGREQPVLWTDKSGIVWFFGGQGYDSNGIGGLLNDLWKLDPTQGANGEWTWMGGSNVLPPGAGLGNTPSGEPGIYGTLGMPSPANVPGGREQTANWIDAPGNLWLFGGIGIDAAGGYGSLNDLWKFDPTLGTNGEWTWMGGSSTAINVSGVYGALGTPASTNIPGGRYGAMSWIDAGGNFWLYGGNGYASTTTNGYLNDLWMYTPGANGSIGNWTWAGGNDTVPASPGPGVVLGQTGVYGTLGTPATTNIPGGRSSTVAWTDTSGNVWVFGGLGADSTGTVGYLNDLWMYAPAANGNKGEWTWMGGSSTVGSNFGGQPGVYGIQGIADSANLPGGRFSPITWVDASGNFWLFGGQGYDWTGTQGYLNDLWMYTPNAAGNTGQWTWMGGNTSIGNSGGQSGIYGALGTPGPANSPGGRYGAQAWTDASGHLWLFGGHGYDGIGTQGYLNDLWSYQQ
jgi:hypothetical protein